MSCSLGAPYLPILLSPFLLPYLPASQHPARPPQSLAFPVIAPWTSARPGALCQPPDGPLPGTPTTVAHHRQPNVCEAHLRGTGSRVLLEAFLHAGGGGRGNEVPWDLSPAPLPCEAMRSSQVQQLCQLPSKTLSSHSGFSL